MGGGVHQVGDDVVLAQLGRLHTTAPAGLAPVGGGGDRLHVPRFGDGDDQLLVGDEVLEREVALVGDDPRPPGHGVLLLHRRELLGDNRPPQGRVGQDRLQLLDQGVQLGQLVPELLGLERTQPAQRHVEDGVGLDLAQLEALDEAGAGVGGVGRPPDDPDHLVDVVDGDDQAFEDVGPGAGLIEPEAGPPLDHLHLVVEVVADHLADVEGAGDAVDQRDGVDPEGVLELGQLVELVEDDLGDGRVLELDHQPGPDPGRRLVAEVGDALEPLVVDQVGDLLHHPVLGDLIGQLGDDDGGAALPHLLHVGDRPHLHRAPPGGQGVADAGGADDVRPGGEVGALDEPHQVLGLGLRVLEGVQAGRDHLAQVVGRDVGRHADGDPLRPVDQQIREPGREDRRLLVLAVVVLGEVDGVLVDPLEQSLGDRGETALGVVVDESIRQEGVVIGVHPYGEHPLLTGRIHRLDGGVEVAMLDDVVDEPERVGLTAGLDVVAKCRPPFVAVEVVLGEPLTATARRGRTQVLGDEGNPVLGYAASGFQRAQDGFQFPALRPPEPDLGSEPLEVRPSTDVDLDLTRLVSGESRHDAEFEEELLHLLGEELAPGRVRDLCDRSTEPRAGSIPFEESLEEGPLHLGLRRPHKGGHPLGGAAQPLELCEGRGGEQRQVLNVQLVEIPARRKGPLVPVPLPSDDGVVEVRDDVEEALIRVVEACPIRGHEALGHEGPEKESDRHVVIVRSTLQLRGGTGDHHPVTRSNLLEQLPHEHRDAHHRGQAEDRVIRRAGERESLTGREAQDGMHTAVEEPRGAYRVPPPVEDLHVDLGLSGRAGHGEVSDSHGPVGRTHQRVTGDAIPHLCRGVVDRAEVPLGVDERVEEREVLAQPHQGVVDRLVAVGVIAPHHVADDGGALPMPGPRAEVRLVHGVDDPALDRLEPVPHVGEGTGHDDRHGVVHEGLRHLVVDVDAARLGGAVVGGEGVVAHRDPRVIRPGSGRPWRSAG